MPRNRLRPWSAGPLPCETCEQRLLDGRVYTTRSVHVTTGTSAGYPIISVSLWVTPEEVGHFHEHPLGPFDSSYAAWIIEAVLDGRQRRPSA